MSIKIVKFYDKIVNVGFAYVPHQNWYYFSTQKTFEEYTKNEPSVTKMVRFFYIYRNIKDCKFNYLDFQNNNFQIH